MINDSSSSFQITEPFYGPLFEALTGNNVLLKTNAPIFTILAASPSYIAQTGASKEAMIGKGIFEAFPGSADPANTGSRDLLGSLNHVLQTKEPHQLPMQRYDTAGENGQFVKRYWRAINKPVLAPNGEVAYIVHSAEDITSAVKTEQREERIKEIEKTHSLFMQAPVAINILRGPELVVEMANGPSLEIWGKGEEIIGQSLLKVFPELEQQGYKELVDQIRKTGVVHKTFEQRVTLPRNGHPEDFYFNWVLQPLYEEEQGEAVGIITFATEVTEQVQLRKKAFENEAKFRNLIEEAPVPTGVFVGRDMVVEIANEAVLNVWGKGNSVFGKPLREALPELEGQPFLQILDDVFTTGKAYAADAARADLVVDGKPGTYYFNFTYKPLRNANGEVYAIMDMAVDVTEQVLARQKLEESEARFRTIIEQAQIGFGLTRGEDMVFESINPPMLELINRKDKADVIGKKVIDVLPELEAQAVYEILHQVFTTGKTFHGNDVPVKLTKDGIRQLRYFNLSYTRIVDANETVFLLHMALDITDQVLARKKLEENEAALEAALEQLRLSKEAAELGTFDMNAQTGEMHWDARCRLLFGISHHKPVSFGTDFIERLHPDDRDRVAEVVRQAHIKSLSNGEYDVEYRTIGAEDGIERWVRAKGKVHFDDKEVPVRFIGSVLDITEQKTAMRKIEESQNSLLALFQQSPVGIATLSAGDDLVFESANTFYCTLTGRIPEEIIGKPLLEALPELKGQGFDDLLKEVIATGKAFIANEVAANLLRHERLETVYVNLTYQPRKEAGKVTGILVIATDVTEQVKSRKQVEESEANLRSMVLEAPVGVCVIDATTLVSEIVNESFIEIAGRPYEAIKGHMYWDTFAEARPYYEAALQGVIESGTAFYANEVKLMLIRHGKEEIIYVTFVYLPMKDFKGRVNKVVIYVLENTPQVVARQKIEEVVEQRTKELAAANETLQSINKELHRSNKNLEEFAHAASHDLQEPVRKISFFTSQLKSHLDGRLNEREIRSLNRIENASKRMGTLIDDLLLYSQVSQRPHETEAVELNEAIQIVLEDLDLDVEEKKASVVVGKLPNVRGYRRQLQQLFQNLLTNSLKYSKADVPPEIYITANVVTENGFPYHVISVKDNGIGFEQEYADRIFQMFSRLHGKAEYSGTGVGLSIVKKIVENHNGFIRVESETGKGSLFQVYLLI